MVSLGGNLRDIARLEASIGKEEDKIKGDHDALNKMADDAIREAEAEVTAAKKRMADKKKMFKEEAEAREEEATDAAISALMSGEGKGDTEKKRPASATTAKEADKQ
uniref:Uncharacterized protein n=1 Tax=Hemiselmis andersenii TaxID=464988 RepID=A0A6U2A8S9_HEMAN|mmetsp:Transcript_10936/g.25638  ORF Transcript_10936/g.25638 Transcript_10936/m.25638 type:complete len:107 (+) Transcript_10936:83-403(+)